MNDALKRLQQAIGSGTVQVVIGRTGAVALRGVNDAQREGLTDVCIYRRLRNTPEMRLALARAQVTAGRTVDERVISSGLHSHDGGTTWSRH
jgi:hypothetical protein